MNPAGRDASVAPDSIAALSCSVVTDRSWWFAGMTDKTPVKGSPSDSPSPMAQWALFLATALGLGSLVRKFGLALWALEKGMVLLAGSFFHDHGVAIGVGAGDANRLVP